MLKSLCMLMLFFIFFACRQKDGSIQFHIEHASNYSYDLNNRTMTVHFRSKPDSVVKFQLSDTELQSVIEKYYSLHLNAFKSKEELQDYFGLPAVPTRLTVYSKAGIQELSFYSNSRASDQVKKEKSERLNTFFQYIDSILSTKPEVQKSKTSDIYYL